MSLNLYFICIFDRRQVLSSEITDIPWHILLQIYSQLLAKRVFDINI